MKNKLVIIASIAGIAVLCIAATNSSQSGGLPALNERLTTLESAVLAEAQQVETLKGQLAAVNSVVAAQASEIETLKAQLAAIKPSPFTEIEAAKLKELSGVVWVTKNPIKVHGTDILVDGNLLVRNSAVMSFAYSKGANFTSSWVFTNAPGWNFNEP